MCNKYLRKIVAFFFAFCYIYQMSILAKILSDVRLTLKCRENHEFKLLNPQTVPRPVPAWVSTDTTLFSNSGLVVFESLLWLLPSSLKYVQHPSSTIPWASRSMSSAEFTMQVIWQCISWSLDSLTLSPASGSPECSQCWAHRRSSTSNWMLKSRVENFPHHIFLLWSTAMLSRTRLS